MISGEEKAFPNLEKVETVSHPDSAIDQGDPRRIT